MITDLSVSNIFMPRNNWLVSSLSCKRYIKSDHFIIRLAKEIKLETGIDPLQQKKSQKREVCDARNLFMAMMTIHTKTTYRQIGRFVGKDHSTVTHSKKVVQDIMETDLRFRETYNKINEFAKNTIR